VTAYRRLQRTLSLGRSRLQAEEQPDSIELPDGSTAWNAVLEKVQMRTAECTFQGDVVNEYSSLHASHYKIEIKTIDLMEKRREEDSDMYAYAHVRMTKKDREQISYFKLEINGQMFDLKSTGFNGIFWSSSDKLQFVIAKTVASLPVQAMLSLLYTSPMGDQWYVDNEPVDIKGSDQQGSTFCSLM